MSDKRIDEMVFVEQNLSKTMRIMCHFTHERAEVFGAIQITPALKILLKKWGGIWFELNGPNLQKWWWSQNVRKVTPNYIYDEKKIEQIYLVKYINLKSRYTISKALELRRWKLENVIYYYKRLSA